MNTKKPKNTTVLWLKICLQPNCYGKTTNKIKRLCVRLVWQGQKDLNPRHVVLETTALPAELYPYITLWRRIHSVPTNKIIHKSPSLVNTFLPFCNRFFTFPFSRQSLPQKTPLPVSSSPPSIIQWTIRK